MKEFVRAALQTMSCLFRKCANYFSILAGAVKNRRPVKVAAAILEKDGKILVARRRKLDRMGGKWEFPGGKIEEGETPEQGLERELKEELDIETKTGEFFCSSRFEYMHVPLEILAYRSRYISGSIKLREHDDAAWVSPAELGNYDFVTGDISIIKKLQQTFR